MDNQFPEKMRMFENRLAKVYKHFSKIARKQDTSCYRFYDHDLPEFPFSIDIYGDYVHTVEYKRRHGMEDETHQAWLDACKQCIAGVLEKDVSLVFIKERKRIAKRTEQYEKFDLQKKEAIVKENGLNFILNLSDYLDTGLFLDHRITRKMVMDQAQDKKVLNLFCYTGSFSVYAAKGGADTVVSVDMSKTYINWAKRNMQYNKLFHPEKHFFIQEDVMEWIKTAPADTFDIIVCDPPTFSNSKRMEDIFDVQRDHVLLLKRLLKLLKDDGCIYFSNNYRGFELDRDAIPASIVKDITGATTPFDFQGKLHRSCFYIQK